MSRTAWRTSGSRWRAFAKGIENADDLKNVLDDLTQSYGLNRKLGRPDGIAAVGHLLAELLAQLDQTEPASEILAEVQAALLKLGRTAEAAVVADRIAQLGG